MTDHDNVNDPAEPTDAPPPPVAPPAAPTSAAPGAAAAPAVAPQARWRDRVFRMRAVAAVAVAGVILGAAGGAATTALVSDSHPDRGGEQRFGPTFHPGMPGLPPGGQMRFPGDESDGQSSDDEPLPVDPSSEPSSSESAS